MTYSKIFAAAAILSIGIATAEAQTDFTIPTQQEIDSTHMKQWEEIDSAVAVPLSGIGPLQYSLQDGHRTDPERQSMGIAYDLSEQVGQLSPTEFIHCATLKIGADKLEDQNKLAGRSYSVSAHSAYLAALLKPAPDENGKKVWKGCVKVETIYLHYNGYHDAFCVQDKEIGLITGMPFKIRRPDGRTDDDFEPSMTELPSCPYKPQP